MSLGFLERDWWIGPCHRAKCQVALPGLKQEGWLVLWTLSAGASPAGGPRPLQAPVLGKRVGGRAPGHADLFFPRKQPGVEQGLLAEACGARTLDPFGGGIPFSEHLERTLHALRDFFFLNFEN